MKRARPVIVVVLLLVAAFVIWRLLGRSQRDDYLSGYITADELYLSAPVSGTVDAIAVSDGQRVAAGQPMFQIAPATLAAQGEQASANVRASETQIASAQAGLTQAQANVAANAAAAERARRDLARLESVKRADAAAVAGKDIDAARAALREADANVAAARKAADARRAEIAQARAQTQQAVGGKRGVDIQLGQLAPGAPAAGRVREVFFQKGEWVTANQPVVSIIPDGKMKVRFFVPEAAVARYRPGQTVRFTCDGCARGLTARIGYVSAEPEFTPPVIFSRESRDRLVFMVEAYPTDPARLNPGMPIEVGPLQ